jgi:hypothetical protein
MAASLPRPGVSVVQVFQSVSPTIITPTLPACVVGVCRQVVPVLTTTALGTQVLNSQALVQLQASLLAAAATGTPPVYAGLNGLAFVLSLSNGPALTVTFTGSPLSPAQVVSQVLAAFTAAGVTGYTVESVGTTQWRIRSFAADQNQQIQILTGTAPAVLAAFGFAISKITAGKAFYDQHLTQISTSNFPDPNHNLAQVTIDPTSVRAFLFLGGSTIGSALFELLRTASFLENGIGTPATVTGSVDMTTGGLYGGGGTLDTKTLILTFNVAATPLTVTFAAPANVTAALAQINAVISAVGLAVTLAGSNFLQITSLLLGAPASILVGAGTGNATVGISPGTQTGTAGVVAIDSGSGQAVTPILQFVGANFTASATAAQIVGTTVISAVADGLTLTLDDGDEPQTLTFLGATTSTLILAQINALFGAVAAGRTVATINGSTHLVLTNAFLGTNSIMKVVGGTALGTLGLTAATVVRGLPFPPIAGDEVWVDGLDYATITQVAPGGNNNQLKINKLVPISTNVGLAWFIRANNLNVANANTGVTRPYPDLVVDSLGNVTLKPEMLRDNRGNPVAASVAQMYLAYKGLRQDVTAKAKNPSLLRFGDTTTLGNILSPITTDNPLGLGIYFALLNSPGVQVTGLGVDEASSGSPNGTVNGFTRAAAFLEGFEVYGLAPLTHDASVSAIFNTHVNFMSQPDNKGERIVLVNGTMPTHKLDTLVASGVNGNTTPTTNTFDTSVVNLSTLLLAQGLPSAGPYTTANGIYLDIGDGNKYNIINVVGSVATIKTSAFQPGENDDAYYATSTLPSPLIAEPFAVRIRGAALVLLDGTPDKDNIALTVQQVGQGYGNRRVWNVVPDQCAALINGIEQIIDGFYMSAAVVGMIGKQPPQQSFTNFPMTGFTRVIGSNDTYSTHQLNVMAAGGNYIIVQDTTGAPLIARMALTTDMTSIETRTDSVTKIVDFCSKFIRTMLRNFIGRFNITQGFLDSLGHVIQGGLGFLSDAGILIGHNLNNIIQDTTQPDSVIIDCTLDVPLPCNYIRLVLSI